MKKKALGWAHETPNLSALPEHVPSPSEPDQRAKRGRGVVSKVRR
jgi:hypothetical protein